MNELFEGYPFLRVLSKCTHLDYSSLLIPQGPLSSSLGHFDSIHRCHSILYQTCKCSRPTSRTVMPLPSTGVPETGGITGTPRTRIVVTQRHSHCRIRSTIANQRKDLKGSRCRPGGAWRGGFSGTVAGHYIDSVEQTQ